MVTLDDYFRAYDSEGGDWRKRYPLDMNPRLEANAERTVYLINQLLIAFGAWRKFVSGWRPPAYNAKTPGASKTSLHMTCEAGDLEDNDGELDDWCMSQEGEDTLKTLGLWHEHPSSTKGANGEGWCHVQTRPPGSRNRHFYR
jgi:hypothetical protein